MPNKEDSPKSYIKKAIIELNEISPIREIKDISYSKISEWILKEYGVKKSSDSIRMWINRNSKTVEKHLDKISTKQNIVLKSPNIKESNINPQIREEFSDNQIVIKKHRVPALNRVRPISKLKMPKIKLCLNEFESHKDAIRYALEQDYNWNEYNVKEIWGYILESEKKLNPVIDGLKVVEKVDPYTGIKYDVSVKNKPKPAYSHEWIKYLKILLILWEITKPKNKLIRELNLTTREWYEGKWFKDIENILRELYLKNTKGYKFEGFWLEPNWDEDIQGKNKYDLKKLYDKVNLKEFFDKNELTFPPDGELKPEENYVIENLEDLKRIGVFEALDYIIKHEIKIEDDIEKWYFNYDKLDMLEKNRAHSMIIREKRRLKSYQYYILLKEKIERDKRINSKYVI